LKKLAHLSNLSKQSAEADFSATGQAGSHCFLNNLASGLFLFPAVNAETNILLTR
jgi:hypothetical protein